jgi:D-ribulokinase
LRLALGIDIGTSGCRGVAINSDGAIRAEASVCMPAPRTEGARSEQAPELWWETVYFVLRALAAKIPPAEIGALAVDGTSATLLLADATGRPLGPALMYNDARATREAARIAASAPPDCAAHGAGSALAKLLHLQQTPAARPARHALHQADWIAGRLSGRFGISDENNCLKLGYDAARRRWPEWLADLGVDTALLPGVMTPGSPIGTLQNDAVRALGYPDDLCIVAGTTDGVAAFLATGAETPGDAVTSLGSTLVVKVLSAQPVVSALYGIYSHRLGDLWLAGGASNSGGAVLLRYFTVEQIEALTPRLDPATPTGLDYYPLGAPGERFPYNDSAFAPRLAPRPDDDARFLQGMLEGIAAIEALGYRRLAELGAPAPARIFSVGGGARNPAWTAIRRSLLAVPFEHPRSEQACYGAALLAQQVLASDTAHKEG